MNQSFIHRRHFVKQAAVATTGTLLLPNLAAANAPALEAKPVSGNSSSLTHDVIYSANKGDGFGNTKEEIRTRLTEFKSLGYHGMESVSPGIADTRAVREVSEELEFPIHGVVDMVHWHKRLSSPDANVREEGRLALEQAIRDSKAIGGSSVLLVPGQVTGDDENHDQVWQRSIEQIRQVLPLASQMGIQVLIENVWNGFCESPEQLRDYVDEIDSPWVGIYFDIGNSQTFAPAEDWIRLLGSRIVKLDIKDWGTENGFCRLGEGDVDWAEVRNALAEIRFSGWATREGQDQSHEDTVQLIAQLLQAH